jgi:hypothetical protein
MARKSVLRCGCPMIPHAILLACWIARGGPKATSVLPLNSMEWISRTSGLLCRPPLAIQHASRIAWGTPTSLLRTHVDPIDLICYQVACNLSFAFRLRRDNAYSCPVHLGSQQLPSTWMISSRYRISRFLPFPSSP